MVARTILEREGHKVRFASDGENALTLCRSVPFDIALLDIVMPGTTGLDVARHLRMEHRQSGNQAHLPVLIALTAYDGPDDLNRCRSAGFDGVIAKPLRQGDLAAAMAGVGTDRSTVMVGVAANSGRGADYPLLDELVLRDGPGQADELTRAHILKSFRSGLAESLKALSASLPGCMAGEMSAREDFLRALHGLRSASLTVGMDRAPRLARELRQSPPDRLAQDTVTLLHAIRDTLPQLEHRLRGSASVAAG